MGPCRRPVTNWMFVELTAGDMQIVLAICADTLYLYGWRKGSINETCTWAVTNGDVVNLAQGYRWLPFHGH